MSDNLANLIDKAQKANRQLPPKKQYQKVVQLLLSKGYSRSQIENGLAEVTFEMEEETQWQLIEQAGTKALKSLERKYSDGQLWQKIKENLYRKGYDYNLIKRWVDQLE